MNIKLAIQGSTDKESVQNILAVSCRIANALYGQNTTRVLNLDGATSIIRVVEDSATIIISSESGGVFIHPRAGNIELMTHYEWESYQGIGALVSKKVLHGVAGGWKDGKTEITTKYIYPLIDEDNASYTLFKEDGDSEIEGEFSGDSGNYGNLYWWNGREEEPVFLSWKGTPSRHFRLPSTVSIDGFTIQETASPGLVEDTPFFTSFGQHIYQDGSILITAPRYNWPYSGQDRCFVLGAAQDTEGTVWAVMQSDRYNVPRYIVIFSNGHRIITEDSAEITEYLSKNPRITIVFQKEYETKKGVYTVLWKFGGPVDGWTWIAEWNTGRQGLPWFGDSTGSYFINPLGSQITTGGVKTELNKDGVGRLSLSAAPVEGVISVSKNGIFTSSYTNDALFEPEGFATIALNFQIKTTKEHVDTRTKVYEGSFSIIYDPNDPDQTPQPLAIYNGPDFVRVGEPFHTPLDVRGGQGNLEITYIGFTYTDGIVTSMGCGMGEIRVKDACGTVVTRAIRLEGVWLQQSTSTASHSCNVFGSATIDYISGSSRVRTTWCNFDNIGTGSYIPGCILACTGYEWGGNCYSSVTYPTPATGAVGTPPSYLICPVSAGYPYKLMPYAVETYSWVCP